MKIKLNGLLTSLLLRFYNRPQFGKWINLENLRSSTLDAVETDKFAEFIIAYVSTALHIPKKFFVSMFWMDLVLIFYGVVAKNSVKTGFPILDVSPNKPKSKELPWEYAGRSYYVWAHLFASNYGWPLSKINNLDVDHAIGLIQEIFTEEQLNKEFQWAMSEIAYPYDKATKTNKFKALERPEWMFPKAKPIEIVKIPKSFMPVGNIVDLSGMNEQLEKQRLASQETKPN